MTRENRVRIAVALGVIALGLFAYFALGGVSEFWKSLGIEIVGAGIIVLLLDQSTQALLDRIELAELRRQEREKQEAARQEAFERLREAVAENQRANAEFFEQIERLREQMGTYNEQPQQDKYDDLDEEDSPGISTE